MIRSSLLVLLLGFVLFSCGSEEIRSKEDIQEEIKSMEKKVEKLSTNTGSEEAFNKESTALIEVLVEYYHSYPKDAYSADCLSKVHMIYSRMNDTEKSVAYADTLLSEFPKYENRAQMIESQIMAYEMLIEPRNVAMIEKYLKLWIKENKNAPKGKIADMKYHLKFVNMSLEDRMKMNMQELD